jgi:hypothetical protein
LGILAALLLAGLTAAVPCRSQSNSDEGGAKRIYLPVYSHVYSGDKERPFYLTVTVSIRNTDAAGAIDLLAVDYHGSDGKLLRAFVAEPVAISPLASVRYVVKESDKSGGSGAAFVVKWKARNPVTDPIVEGIMIGTRSGQGLSFVTRGVPAEEPGSR